MSDIVSTVARPDPSVLTTAQLLRELLNLRELIEARLTGQEREVGLLNSRIDKVPVDVEQQIAHLKALHDERFAGLRELIDAQKDSATLANSIAFQAQEKAAAKSEIAAAEKQNGLAALVDRSLAALGEKVNDLSSRADRSEAAFNGMSTQRGETRMNFGLMLTLCTMAAAMVSIFIEIVIRKGM